MKSTTLCCIVIALLPAIAFAQGQIKMSQEIEQTWVGFENPKVVNGVLVAGPNSKPMLAATSMRVVVTGGEEYKWTEIECDRIPTLESVDLNATEGGYTFPKDAAAGSYRIVLRKYDPVLQPIRKVLMVELKPQAPIDPIIPDLGQGLSSESRKAIVGLVQSMAKDMTVIADGIKGGSIKTTEDVRVVNTKQDEAGRAAFKATMKSLMEPKLGTAIGPLVPEAESVFRNISAGFGSVK